ncbi:methyl-accepting chemotaxis protein [Vibrio nomapromontoriensis]|uniref:methyl-accepting chemotaxis protein n=1 Tax=Vibrio nomapromontoriensis TaxID=2910246 RepID=UPI003D12F6E3
MNNEDREYLIQENEILVSTTDMSGNITFADDNFVRVSGYSREELLGSPHNIVRHPDMPKELFKDFWQEISSGNCWSGIIKNRQKDGGYYWVKSDVTPYYQDGVQQGFMSVRSKPNKVDLEKAKIQYSQFKEGEQGNFIIKRGKVVKKQRSHLLKSLTIKQRLFGLVLVATISLLTVLGIGIHSSYTEKEAVENLYLSHIESYSRLRTINELWKENRLLLQSLLLTNDFEHNLLVSQTLKENAFTLEQTTSTLLDKFDLEHNDKIERYQIIADQSDLLATTSLADIYSSLTSSEESNRSYADFRSLIQASIIEIATYEKSMNDLILENRLQSSEIYEQSKQVFWFEVALASVITLLFICAYLIFAFIFSRDINTRLNDIRRYFMRLVKQDYLFEINVEKDDEIGHVLQSLKIMKVQLAYSMESLRQQAVAVTRIKIALDNVSTNMMIVDSENTIIYVNPSIIDMFKQAEEELEAFSPGFDANALLGININELKLVTINQQTQSINAHQLTNQAINIEETQEIDINGRIFRIVSNPVIDEAGRQIGYVTEWADRTSEIAVEREIEHVIQSAVKGDFSQRMALDGKNTFFTMLCSNMNRLLEISEVSLTDIVTVLSSLAKGDLTSQITADYSGAFGELKTSSNLTVTKLKEMLLHIKVSADTINTATKEIAIGNIDLAQRTEKQARSLEVTSSSMEELTITVKQNSEHSKQANRLAKETSVNALKGGEVVTQVVENMADIHTSSQEVMNIISVIDSIAFQTNILALNAAVEAARAGEQGRGFAVVATEVRNLAQRSAAAAKEVESLINSSVRKIEIGSKLATQAGDSISGVVMSIQEVAQLIEEITQASVEQSVGIDQVTRAILEVDDVTQQNSALVEEGSAAASSLEEQVANLAIYVAAFDTGEKQISLQNGANELHLGNQHSYVTSGAHNHDDDNDWSEF